MNTSFRRHWAKRIYRRANDLALPIIIGLLVFICVALAKMYPLAVDMARAAQVFITTVTGHGHG